MGRAARMGRVDVAEVSRLLPARRASDAALVRSAQRGSERAVEELFARHWPDAYRTALLIAHDRAAAEDIAQEAFVAALRALPRFDRSRPLRPWLHRIVVNRAIDWARARRLRREVDGEAVPEAAAPEAVRGSARWAPRSRSCRPSTARSWSCATCSSSRPARSRPRSSSRAGP